MAPDTGLAGKLNAQYEGEMGNRVNIHIEGPRIKRTMRPVSLELYDKFGHNQQIGTTDNDLTFFSHPSPLIEPCKVGLAEGPPLIEPFIPGGVL